MEEKLEEGRAAKLKVPKGQRDVRVWDTQQPGLYLRKLETGSAHYGVRFRVHGKLRQLKIAEVVPEVKGLALAREEANRIRAKAILGQDLRAELAAAKEIASRPVATLGDVVARYLKARKPGTDQEDAAGQDDRKRKSRIRRLRPRSYEEVRRHLETNLKGLHKRPIAEITRPEIVDDLDELADEKGGPTADAAKRALSKLYAWSIARGLCATNPTMYIEPYGDNDTPKRKLSMAELVEIWRAAATLSNVAYGRIVRALVLTGCRRDEIGGLDWSEIDEAVRLIVLPPSRTKNKREHRVPMCDQLLDLLPVKRNSASKLFGRFDREDASGYGGWSKAKVELDQAIHDARLKLNRKADPMPAWRIHDLRHAFATLMHEGTFDGAPNGDVHLVEMIINHSSGTKGGIAGRYDASERLDARRKALEAWGRYVQGLVAATAS
jgi:integrase